MNELIPWAPLDAALPVQGEEAEAAAALGLRTLAVQAYLPPQLPVASRPIQLGSPG